MSNQSPKIKKIALIFIIIFAFFQLTGNAQSRYNEDYHRLTGGLTAAAALMQVDGDGYKGYHKVGFSGGGILYLPLGDVDLPFDATIALSMEVLYTQKGAKGKGAVPNSSITSQEISLHYGEIPIQVNLYRGTRKSNFGMGLSIGYLGFSEETITEFGGVKLKNALPFKKFDFCFVLTGNVHLWNGFFLGPKFEYSLLSVRNNNSRYGGRNEQFNNILALRFMYVFKSK